MDFAEICVLPETFAACTMDTSLAPIAESLGLLNNSNTASMARILHVLWMIADPTFGASTCT